MTVQDHTRFADDVGAYLLGALEPHEEQAFEDHLDVCHACQLEVDRLELARDALPQTVEPVAPPPSLKAALMQTVLAEERERAAGRAAGSTGAGSTGAGSTVPARLRGLLLARPPLAAALAVALVAIGIAAGALVGAVAGGGGDADVVTASVDAGRHPGGSAELLVPDVAYDQGGAVLRVRGLQQAPEGRVYQVWLKRGERIEPSSLFAVARDGSGAAGIPERLDGVDAVMVTTEQSGGARAPSEPPSVTVDVPA